MICAIDIGNTTIHLGIYYQDKLKTHFKILVKDIFKNGKFLRKVFGKIFRENAPEELQGEINYCKISSVNSKINKNVEKWLLSNLPNLKNKEIILEYSQIKGQFKFNYPEPETIGLDRLMNTKAALSLYKSNFIILDLGSASTFSIVNLDGEFIGGIIAPGPRMILKSLGEDAFLLPKDLSFPFDENLNDKISRNSGSDKIESKIQLPLIGKSTGQSMQSGIFYGYMGMLNEILKELDMNIKINCNKKPSIIITGGYGKEISSLLKKRGGLMHFYHPSLTLDGIKIFADKPLLDEDILSANED